MGKPRMILLIRHAQSEGNKNRDIHQYIPDHRVKLTPDGVLQAEEAGRRLRSMLKPDDKIQFFTSPYRRTRETTNSILNTLTSDDPEQGPSPFPRHKITVYEEPRLREQDFGNFQPCSAEMERMWQERADYGHFFYRISNGESAADAYDRVSGFNESLWRQFGDPDFPSVCVIVTHGLMTRIFLMKWYHWSVEYFEDLRNVNHCEFIVMKQNPENGKYLLENELRTWSDLKRRIASNEHAKAKELAASKPTRKWGGCVDGCDHSKFHLPHRPRRQNTNDFATLKQGGASAGEKDAVFPAPQDAEQTSLSLRKRTVSTKSLGTNTNLPIQRGIPASGREEGATPIPASSSAADEQTQAKVAAEPESDDIHGDASDEDQESSSPMSSPPKSTTLVPHLTHNSNHIKSTAHGIGRGRLFTSLEEMSGSDEADESDYFDTNIHQMRKRMSHSEHSRSKLSQSEESPVATSSPRKSASSSKLKALATKSEKKQWKNDSGMTSHKRADALGDVDEDDDAQELADVDDMKEKDRKTYSEIF